MTYNKKFANIFSVANKIIWKIRRKIFKIFPEKVFKKGDLATLEGSYDVFLREWRGCRRGMGHDSGSLCPEGASAWGNWKCSPRPIDLDFPFDFRCRFSGGCRGFSRRARGFSGAFGKGAAHYEPPSPPHSRRRACIYCSMKSRSFFLVSPWPYVLCSLPGPREIARPLPPYRAVFNLTATASWLAISRKPSYR